MELQAGYIGNPARQALGHTGRGGTILGVTRRGAFLQAGEDSVVYLSLEKWRGPLTLNLAGPPDELRSLSPGDTYTVEAGWLRLGERDLFIDLANAAEWTPPPRPVKALAAAELQANLHTVARLLLERKVLGSTSPLLPLALGLPLGGVSWPSSGLLDLAGLRTALRAEEPENICAALEPWLGLGPGLTPSGDDLALGVLFCLNRWGEALAPGLDFSILNRLLPRLAAQKTSRLSASLIACAAKGEADERLALALDGILSGNPKAGACADYLAAWGSSSGCDALAGMGLVVMI